MMTFSKLFQSISETHNYRDQNFQELRILSTGLLSPASLFKPRKKKYTLNDVPLDLIVPFPHTLSPAATSSVFNSSVAHTPQALLDFIWGNALAVHSHFTKWGMPAVF